MENDAIVLAKTLAIHPADHLMSPTRNHPVPLYSPSAKLVVVADYGGQTKQQVNRPSSRRRNEHVKGHMRCKQCACCLPQAKVNANRGTTAATYQSPHGLHAHPVTLHGCRECPSSQQIAKHCLLAMEQVGIGTQVFKAQSHRRAVCWQTDQPISKAEGAGPPKSAWTGILRAYVTLFHGTR